MQPRRKMSSLKRAVSGEVTAFTVVTSGTTTDSVTVLAHSKADARARWLHVRSRTSLWGPYVPETEWY